MEREALKLALEALEESIDTVRHAYEADWRHGYPTRKAQLASMKQGVEDHEQAITAVKAALAQPAQEPVARVTGVYGGRFTYEPINPAMLLPVGMALYAAPIKEKNT